MMCPHSHLKFSEDGNSIKCIDCPWEAHVKMPGVPHPMLLMDSTRHTKWELSRDKPLPKPEPKKPLPKKR